MKVVSLFSGFGGSAQGYINAGHEVLSVSDIDKRAIQALTHNLRVEKSHVCSVEYLANNIPSEYYDVDLLDASPECKTFSRLNTVTQQHNSSQTEALAYIIKIAKPKIVLIENVIGYLNSNVYRQFTELIYHLYAVSPYTLNTLEFGVPQKRKRAIIILTRRDIRNSRLALNFFDSVQEPATAFVLHEEYKRTELKRDIRFIWEVRQINETIKACGTRLHSAGVVGSAHRDVELLKHHGFATTLTTHQSCIVHDEIPFYPSIEDWRFLSTWSDTYDFLGSSPYKAIGQSNAPKFVQLLASCITKANLL